MLSSLYRRLLCVCLAFGLLLGISLPSYADEVEDIPYITYFSDEELSSFEIGEWLTGGEGIFFSDNRNPAKYGLITDYSDLVSIDLDFYSDVYGFEDNNTFLPNASIAYSKLYNNYPYGAMNIASVTDWINASNGIVGYNIRLNYVDEEQGSLLTEGSKIILDLAFPLTVYGGAEYNYTYCYDYQGKYEGLINSSNSDGYPNYNYLRSNYIVFSDGSSPIYYYNTEPRSYLTNTVEVISTNSNGEISVLATYNDISALNGSFDLTDDSEFITVSVKYDFSDSTTMDTYGAFKSGVTFRFFSVDVSGTVEVEKADESIGLIKGIIEWLKSILNAILELPQNIANKVKDVIVSLFVPTSEGLSASFDGLKNMAESKLGFVYTGFSMVYSLLNSIVTGVVEPMDTLTLPRLVIPFRHIDGGEFVLWEEMTFNIVPDGMEVLQNLSKLVTSLVLVWLTMRRCLNYFKDFFSKE